MLTVDCKDREKCCIGKLYSTSSQSIKEINTVGISSVGVLHFLSVSIQNPLCSASCVFISHSACNLKPYLPYNQSITMFFLQAPQWPICCKIRWEDEWGLISFQVLQLWVCLAHKYLDSDTIFVIFNARLILSIDSDQSAVTRFIIYHKFCLLFFSSKHKVDWWESQFWPEQF